MGWGSAIVLMTSCGMRFPTLLECAALFGVRAAIAALALAIAAKGSLDLLAVFCRMLIALASN